LAQRLKMEKQSSLFRRNVVCVVVDKAHKVSWGAESDGENVFRKTFSRIGEIRSFIGESILVLALNATVNKDYSLRKKDKFLLLY